MNQVQTHVDAVIEHLRACGYRVTPQRATIIKALIASERHPSAEGIYEEVRESFPMMSLATVYKTIAVLKELGEVTELHVIEGGTHFDAHRPYRHPHLICASCGDVIDVHVENVDQIVQEVAESTGYEIMGRQLDLWGLCPRCQAKA